LKSLKISKSVSSAKANSELPRQPVRTTPGEKRQLPYRATPVETNKAWRTEKHVERRRRLAHKHRRQCRVLC